MTKEELEILINKIGKPTLFASPKTMEKIIAIRNGLPESEFAVIVVDAKHLNFSTNAKRILERLQNTNEADGQDEIVESLDYGNSTTTPERFIELMDLEKQARKREDKKIEVL